MSWVRGTSLLFVWTSVPAQMSMELNRDNRASNMTVGAVAIMPPCLDNRTVGASVSSLARAASSSA